MVVRYIHNYKYFYYDENNSIISGFGHCFIFMLV